MIINPSCLGEFDRPEMGEFEVANREAVQYLKAIAQIRFRHAPVKELAED